MPATLVEGYVLPLFTLASSIFLNLTFLAQFTFLHTSVSNYTVLELTADAQPSTFPIASRD